MHHIALPAIDTDDPFWERQALRLEVKVGGLNSIANNICILIHDRAPFCYQSLSARESFRLLTMRVKHS